MTLDEAVLRQARDARDRMIGFEREADLARVSYQHAIRRLHAAGGSLREIADALGLSYQRVHQIVDVGAGKGAVKPSLSKVMRCSFCDRSQAEARKLIAGPGLAICDGCVDLALEALDTGAVVTRGTARLEQTEPSDAKARCNFCGKSLQQAPAMAEAPGRLVAQKYERAGRRKAPPRICSECLELCGEILSEELGQ
jgi:hypothetical protein